MDAKTIVDFCGFSEDSQGIADFTTKARVFEAKVKEAREGLLADTLNHITSAKVDFNGIFKLSFGLIFAVDSPWEKSNFPNEYSKIFEATRDRLLHLVRESNSASDMMGFYELIDKGLVPQALIDGVQSTITDRLTALSNGCASLQELVNLFEGCELRERFGQDEVSDIFLKKAGSLADRLKRVAYPDFIALVTFVSQLDDFVENDITPQLREISTSMILNGTDYLELVLWWNHSAFDIRLLIEERLAELNADTSNLLDEQFFHRLSITPLGCKARELLDRELV